MDFRRISFFAALFVSALSGKAQEPFHPAAITPGVTLGYIFGAGLSVGAEVNYTPFVFGSGGGRTATGLYGSINFFHSKGELYRETWYRTLGFGGTAFADERLMFKTGISKTLLRWGSGDKSNKTRSEGWTLDFDLSYDHFRSGAFIGYRLYFPGNACFGLDIAKVNMLYGAYRYSADRKLFEGERE